MTLLQDSVITNKLDDQPNNITESSNTLPRARWNNNRKSRLPQSRQGTIIIEGNILMKVNKKQNNISIIVSFLLKVCQSKFIYIYRTT